MAGEAELLDRAATKLDRLLALTTAGRWRMDGPWVHGGDVHTELVTGGEDRAAVVLGVPGFGEEPSRSGSDLRYVVGVQPSVGRALARWLLAAATEAREVGPNPWAVAVAREILGEEGESGVG